MSKSLRRNDGKKCERWKTETILPVVGARTTLEPIRNGQSLNIRTCINERRLICNACSLLNSHTQHTAHANGKFTTPFYCVSYMPRCGWRLMCLLLVYWQNDTTLAQLERKHALWTHRAIQSNIAIIANMLVGETSLWVMVLRWKAQSKLWLGAGNTFSVW